MEKLIVNDRRTTDIQIAQLEAHFKDFVAEYRRDQLRLEQWKVSTEKRIELAEREISEIKKGLTTLNTLLSKLMVPYKVALWIVTISGIAFIGSIFKESFSWLFEWFKGRV